MKTHLASFHKIYEKIDKNEIKNTIDSYFKLEDVKKHEKIKKKKSEKFNEILLIWFASTNISMFVVEHEATFDFFLKNIPTVDLPVSSTLSKVTLPKIYSNLLSWTKEYIKNESPKIVSIALDMWSDKYKRVSYIGLVVYKIIACNFL